MPCVQLFEAARDGDVGEVERLLKADADVNYQFLVVSTFIVTVDGGR